jgi:hypothetical protein
MRFVKLTSSERVTALAESQNQLPGLNAFVVVPWAPNLIAFRRVSSNFERA